MNKKLSLCLIAIAACLSLASQPKREFRGAWIQCVNGQFQGLSTQTLQATLTQQLDTLAAIGVNAIVFQVRPECDALYESSIEPWSRFLTGVQGQAPSPYWDPLKWMVDECHKRGMELHAWINPYRAKTKATPRLAGTHIAAAHPELCFNYDGLTILNPGIPQNSDYICTVVKDIVTRYDVDGLHLDDYFYPYPVAGETIPDDAQFKAYSNGIKNKADWRRYNVNRFIEKLYKTVHEAKPWVKVGISPFGIYRNKKSAPNIGSQTNGLQNYDDLYADVLLWVNNGWMDYLVPQIYWEIGNKAADYQTLIEWWNKYAGSCPLFIGEDIERTVKAADLKNSQINQMPAKMRLHTEMPHVKGTMLWYAKAAVDNVGNYANMLRKVYWKHPALQPAMAQIDNKAPKKPKKVQPVWTKDGYLLFWTAPKGKSWKDKAEKYVVYRFKKGEKVNIGDPSKIILITDRTFLKLPYQTGKQQYTYVVTALDRLQNESKPAKKSIKL